MSADHEMSGVARTLLAALVVVVVLAVVVASIVAGVETRSDLVTDEAQAPVERPPTPSNPTTPPSGEPGPTPTGDAEIDAVLDELARFVEQERGLEFTRPVTVEVLADGPFEDRLLATTEEDMDDVRTDAKALQALGFVDDIGEVEDGLRTLLEAGVLGFYNPETGELVVRGDDFGPMTRQTITHELTHALDDQWFGLDRPEHDESGDEVGFGLSALAEGNARRIDRAYAEGLSAQQKRQLAEEELGLASPSLLTVPPVLIELISAPYDFGEPLVDELLDRRAQTGLDDAFRAPPRTSEQVLDTDKFFAGEQAIPVAAPPADGTVVDDGMFGQLMLRLLVEQALGSSTASEAAIGWGGDSYVVWQAGEDYCIRIDVAADTDADLAEIDDALREVADELPAASVEQAGDRVRFTSCA